MGKSLYCYEKGDCRGYEFGSKIELNIKETIATINQAIKLKEVDEDAYEEFVDNLTSKDEGAMVYHLINGSDVVNEKVSAKDRVRMIKDGKSFHIVLEESEIGFGHSKKEAKLAYVECVEDGEEW